MWDHSTAVLGLAGTTLHAAHIQQRVKPSCLCIRADWSAGTVFSCFPGLPGGPAYQVRTIPRPVQHLSNQALLHLQHPHHPAVCSGVKPIRHLPDAISAFQWQPACQLVGHLVCKSGRVGGHPLAGGVCYVSCLGPAVSPEVIFSGAFHKFVLFSQRKLSCGCLSSELWILC